MGELRYAILGLINRSPVTGYDITKHFNDSISKFWDAKHSQIYPELRRLLEEGLVEYKVTIQGERMEKKLYSITDEGHEELLRWLRSDDALPPVPKDSFRLRLYFGDNLTSEELESAINLQYRKVLERLDEVSAKQALFAEAVRSNPRDFGEFLLINGAVLREAAYLKWLEDCAWRLGFTVSP